MFLFQLVHIFAVFSLICFEPSSGNKTSPASPGNAGRNATTPSSPGNAGRNTTIPLSPGNVGHGEHVQNDPMLWLQHNVCTVRYSFRDITKSFQNCTLIKERNPICGRDITVVYSPNPPFAMEGKNSSAGFGTGQYKGILFGILEETIIKTCCMSCNKLNILPPVGFIDKFHNREKYDLILPIEGGENNKMFFSTPFYPLMTLKAIAFIGKPPVQPNVDLLEIVFDTVWSSWSLVLLAIMMAFAAGSAIWVLDTWYNKPQFPRSFPRGPFEGFWWAYVSMTTVGYGDRTPQSIAARLFAIVWILIGIVFFNVYTSMFTSVLSVRMGTNVQFSVLGEKVGILENTSAPFVGASANMALIQVYPNLSSLGIALRDNEIHAIAMVELAALFHLDYFKRFDSSVDIQHRTEISGSTLGVITANIDLFGTISTFFDANEESLQAIITGAVMSQVDDLGYFIRKKKTDTEFTSLFISSSKIWYGCLMFGGVTIGLGILGWFLNYGIKHRKLARNKVEKRTNDDNNTRPPVKPSKWIGFYNSQYKES
eukprot:TCONS_00052178-protein